MKFFISGLASILILLLSMWLIWNFFQDYNYKFLAAGIFLPILALFLSSQYCFSNTLMLILILLGVIGYFYLENPNNIFAGCTSLFIILVKIFRSINNFTGNYLDINDVKSFDFKFIKSLIISEWYENNKNNNKIDELSINLLINQSFYKENVTPIIGILIANNVENHLNSNFSKESLLKIHAIAVLSCLPNPIIKNKEGLRSVGTQLLFNIFANLKNLNVIPNHNPDNIELNAFTASQILNNSRDEYGELTQMELHKYFAINPKSD